MIVSKSILISLAMLISSMAGYAQNNNTCPDNAAHPKNDSEERLADYLNSDSFESVQHLLNLPDLKNEPIELLTDSNNSCYELNSFRSQNFVNIDPNEDYTYYKVSNYYFMVKWYSVNTTKNRNIHIFDEQYNFMFEELF